MSQELKELLRSVLKEELQPIHERLGRLEEGQLRLEERQQRLEERQQRLEERQQRLEENQLRLEEKLDNFMIETRSHFKKMEDELEQHRHMFELVSNKWKNIEIDIDYLSAKTGKHDTEINKLKKKLEFVQL
ncbi:hypothetical protein EDD69_10838 [Thermolongibacillus altinsuensis]|uniref:Uncharacterized protein n=1 Tax=Thermolongibacillus altinsuensis TaxID=575256 RepID=A0A4R1QF34_9BACL|nr:hypothetical protein [Thermolongibacillus altinsuensis]TCL48783.1 hypothetical protein EDD69_10838 [Thermolongibacillus altinsuensis]